MICLASLAARGAMSYESYRPAARSLLTIVAIGLTVLWPMVRLSQSPARTAVAAWVWKDLVVFARASPGCDLAPVVPFSRQVAR